METLWRPPAPTTDPAGSVEQSAQGHDRMALQDLQEEDSLASGQPMPVLSYQQRKKASSNVHMYWFVSIASCSDTGHH